MLCGSVTWCSSVIAPDAISVKQRPQPTHRQDTTLEHVCASQRASDAGPNWRTAACSQPCGCDPQRRTGRSPTWVEGGSPGPPTAPSSNEVTKLASTWPWLSMTLRWGLTRWCAPTTYWLPHRSRHILTHELGGVKNPLGHVPLVLGPTGRRLAKQDGAVTLRELHEAGLNTADVVQMLADAGAQQGAKCGRFPGAFRQGTPHWRPVDVPPQIPDPQQFPKSNRATPITPAQRCRDVSYWRYLG